MDPEELTARRIADRGRGALLDGLRETFRETAEAHSQLIALDSNQLERMVQAAADRADGVLWRRALAGVAVDELDISLGEAIHHPSVLRATALLGVPGYRGDPAVPANGAPDAELHPPEPRPEIPETPALPPDTPQPRTTLPDPERPIAVAEPPGAEAEVPGAVAPPPPFQTIRVPAVHIGGIETLRAGARNIELRFSKVGLDVINTHDGESIGRLDWDEISELQLPRSRRSLRRRKTNGPELLVRTERGQARFELPSLSEEEATKHLAPVLRRARGDETAG